MEVFRISKSKYIDDLMGTGARLHGGRWNRIGKVPSFVLPQEHNLIINPMHQNFGKVQILMKDEIRLDQRLKTKQQPKTT